MRDMRPEAHIISRCKTCLSSRHFYTDEDFPAEVRDLELYLIEPRMRCQDRGRSGTGPVCGGRGEFEVFMLPPGRDEEPKSPLLSCDGA